MTETAVHPWLMSLREDIFKAKRVARPQPYHAWNMEWMVDKGLEHVIEVKGTWLRAHSPPVPPRPIPAATAAFMASIRASRNR
jgi:hypothetical protein